MDWSWLCTELATTVTGSEPTRLPCVGLHESYGICTQAEQERRTIPANFQRCNASNIYEFSGHMIQKIHPGRR